MAKKNAKDIVGYGTHFPPQNINKDSITRTKQKEVFQCKLATFAQYAFATRREDTAICSSKTVSL